MNKYHTYIYDNDKLNSVRLQKRCFKIAFPLEFEKIEHLHGKEYLTAVYLLCFPEIDNKCKNCESKTNIKSFVHGFRKFCSNKCTNDYQSKSTDFSEAIKYSLKNKHNIESYVHKYGYKMYREGGHYIIIDYCKNGSIRIYANTFHEKMKTNRSLCGCCYKGEPVTTIESLSNVHKYRITNEPWLLSNYPTLHNKIIDWTSHISDLEFKTRAFMFKLNLNKLPTCPVCKVREVSINKTYKNFNLTCEEVSCRKSSSNFEREISNYIRSIYSGEIQNNIRIRNFEIDIYLPKLKIGIECNGIYWHSEKHKSKEYHINKVDTLNSEGINIIQIWDDDYNVKPEIVKSIISSKIHQNKTIFARKCKIEKISPSKYRSFLEDNHLQGWCVSKEKYGLFYNNTVVAVMGFGKKRKILNSKHVDGDWELLRYCSLKFINVVGGASKLLKCFIKEHNPSKIISYANREISIGNLYLKLGFIQNDKTYQGYYWFLNRSKFHRSTFMKYKISTPETKHLTEEEIMYLKGAVKIYNTGNYKYELMLQKKPS